MIRIFFFFFLLHIRFLISQATPLIGKNVRSAGEGEFPFIVSLSLNNGKNAGKEEKNHKCGGSLITRKHVLTAAHCVTDVGQFDELVVKVGSVDLRNALIYKIQWWKTYEKWAENEVFFDRNLSHDIAVVKLLKSVDPTIELPILTETPEIDLYGRKAKTAGWGLLENFKMPRYQRTAKIDVLHFNETLIYNSTADRTPEPNQLLFTKAEPPVKITCGDSGSPLLIKKKEIIGVNVSRCIKGSGEQNVHTSVNYYFQFIKDLMQK